MEKRSVLLNRKRNNVTLIKRGIAVLSVVLAATSPFWYAIEQVILEGAQIQAPKRVIPPMVDSLLPVSVEWLGFTERVCHGW